MTNFNVLLFDEFETLDAFGPAGIIGKMQNTYNLEYYSIDGGTVLSSQHVSVNTRSVLDIDRNIRSILLIPGGMGTRKLIDDNVFISKLNELSQNSEFVLTVCTGSVLLAKTGLLQGLAATSNKRAFNWVCSNAPDVDWIKNARWVNDGKYYTSSGVTAGMDMTVGFICDIHGDKIALDVCDCVEYIWCRDKNNDPFAVQ
ncbi:MAG: DJ-1/PfpI family protein [Defluviitaleaceae bacterium]|nr:DJ-1/PfpI family protein [Defluviitaleaceae bacterium]MCL2274119.1 DJ-1/PfpI family protein [Defluviitaleaceae bacterium]